MSETWMTIDTMPPEQKDGRSVLLGFANNPRTGTPAVSTASWEEAAGAWDCDNWTAGKLADDMGIAPTHWLPIPKLTA